MQQPKPNERALQNEYELKTLRTHLDEARREAALIKLDQASKSLKDQNKGAQPSILVRFIDWQKSHHMADEIEALFHKKELDWHVIKCQADGSTLRNPTHSRVIIESKVSGVAIGIAQLLNDGKLLTEDVVPNDGDPMSDNLDNVDVTVTVFPSIG
jgi:hypothetical protein